MDRRLLIRGRFLAAVLAGARILWAADQKQEALAAVENACRLDPINPEAHKTRVQMLRELGRIGDVSAITESFETKSRRAIERQPAEEVPLDLHPLAKAAEWVLDRNPREALDLLASTPTQWFGIPLAQAVDVLTFEFWRRIRCPPRAKSAFCRGAEFLPSVARRPNRRAVLMTTSGQSYERVRIGTEDTQVAVRIAAAMAFSYLAKGRFSLAIKVGRMQEQIAATGSNQLLLEKAGFNLGILEFPWWRAGKRAQSDSKPSKWPVRPSVRKRERRWCAGQYRGCPYSGGPD